MGKIAFVFSGQGAQRPGMGEELYRSVPEARTVFEKADAVRPGTSAQCFGGTEEELQITANTQPCMFAMELAAAEALTARGVTPDFTAGFSLGELAALTYAGCFPFETGFELVCRRGQLMGRAAEQTDSAMAAVLKLSDEEVEALCAKFHHVYPVNYNCPGQVAVAGLRDELASFTALVKEAGGRAVPLKVGGGFHSQFMAEASVGFGALLRQVELLPPKMPVYSDVTGRPYEGNARKLLADQIMSPVRWHSIVVHMTQQGVDTFVELGPGKTLCGLIQKTDKGVKTLHVEDLTSLEETVKEIQGV